ncbi:MAG: hypothetical protein DRH17_02505 [Deltaproteobacteria bacterium]|nr:MAG: hypothetical protein DRH17_02505 [Deltaproteobacteria bacterium]
MQLQEYLNFGYQPLSTVLFDQPHWNPPRFLMAYDYCSHCGHVQHRYPIDPSFFYEEYGRMRSKIIPAYVGDLTREIRERVGGTNKLVVEIGSNDGMFLQELQKVGFSNVIGIEAAKNCVEAALQNGVTTLYGYFSFEMADKVLHTYGKPCAIIIRHVLEHIDHIDAFLSAVLLMMSEQTLLVIEVPDLMWAIQKGDFTSFTDQHISYFTKNSLTVLLARFGLRIDSISIVPNNWSDALLCFCYRGEMKLPSQRPLSRESAKSFVESMRETAHGLERLKSRGKMVGFGGFCRTVNLINYLHLNTQGVFEFIVDDDPQKYHKYLPGSNLVVLSPDEMKRKSIPFCIICTVNYEAQIIAAHKDYALARGQFVTLFPFREQSDSSTTMVDC